MARTFGNPVHGLIHPANWQRPPGDTSFRLTQDFGPTTQPAEPRVVWPGGEGIRPGIYRHFHRGIDLGNRRCGSEVIAADAGKVVAAGIYSDGAIYVIIDHGLGWRTRYWHLTSETVARGQKVTKGQVIGHVGSTGNSTACHLHFGLTRFGLYKDPWRRLAQNHGP